MAFERGHALLIGVDTHDYAHQINIPFTVQEANNVAAALRDSAACGYPASQVKIIPDPEDPEKGATKAGILAAFDHLVQDVGEEDIVFLLFSGHGALGDDGSYYLVSRDSQFNGDRVASGTGVSENELLEKLRALKSRRILLIFNVCHSGDTLRSIGSEEEFPALAASNPSEDTISALLGTGTGRIIITACREDQQSYIGSGAVTIFTQALVDGLRGKGVANKRGFISVYDLYETLYDTVSTTVKETKKKEQEPELTVNEGVGPLAIALYKGAKTVGIFDETEAAPSTGSVRQVDPAKSQRFFQQKVQQNGGVNFGPGNTFQGPVAGRDQNNVDARNSQGLVINPQSVIQNFGKSSRDEQYAIALNWDRKTRLRGFDLSQRDMSSLDLHGADMQDANLMGADLNGANLMEANLKRANLLGADLHEVNLSGANLEEAVLRKQLLWKIDMSGAILTNADLSEAYSYQANLSKANLEGAKLEQGTLNKAKLEDANLVRADLHRADLSDANLSGANLYGANLSEANLSEANLQGADLLEADLSRANLQRARYDGDTVWPAEFHFQSSGAIGPGADLVEIDLSSILLKGADL